MKKTTFLKSLFLLFALIVGSTSAWADTDVTITMSQQGWTDQNEIGSGTLKSSTTTNSIFTYSSGTGSDGASAGPKYFNSGSDVRFYSKKNGSGNGNYMQINVPENTTITGIELTAVSGYTTAVKYNIDGGSDVSWTASEGKYTVSNISAKSSFKFRNANAANNTNQLRITAIKITYTTTESYKITAQSNNTTYGTVSLDGNVITGSPKSGCRYASPAYTVTAGTATVSQNGNDFNVTPTSDCTVQINFEAIPTHTLSSGVSPAGAGTVQLGSTTVAEGATTTAQAAPNAGYKFTSWSISGTGALLSSNTDNPTTVTMGTANATVTANFEAVTTYPIHWSVNGEIVKTENVEENTAINFAAPTSGVPAGYEFRGWVEEANKIDTPTDEDPIANYVSSANSTAEITYFAVMAVVTGTTLESWEEEDLANMTASDIFVFSNGSYAINNDNGTGSAPDMNSITVSNKKITSTVTDKLKWQVSGNATDGYIFYPNGDDETWLYCNTTASSSSNNNIRVGVGTRKLWAFTQSGYLKTKDSYTTRYLCVYGTQDFRGYTGTDNAFVPKFYKYIAPTNIYKNYCTSVPSATVTITDLSSVTGSTYTGKNYATMYYSDKAFAIPAGVVAKTYKMEGGVLTESRTYELGGENPVIPAGEAVVVESDAGAIYEFSEVVSSASVDENNALCGTDAATTVNTAGYKYYKLAMNDGLDKVGFFFDNADGSAINNGAHKAYLRVSTNSDAKNFYLFDNTVTGINTLDNLTNSQMDNDAPMYNLAGQRVNKSYKGVVIVNGKKMLNK